MAGNVRVKCREQLRTCTHRQKGSGTFQPNPGRERHRVPGQHHLASVKSLVLSLNSECSGFPGYFRHFFPCCTPVTNIPLAVVAVLSARFQQRPGSATQGSVCQNLLCSTIKDISHFATVYALFVNKYWIFRNRKWKRKWFGSFHWAEVCGRRLFIPFFREEAFFASEFL